MSIGEQVTHVVWGRTAFCSSLHGVPSVGERFDVVDQAEERPLPIDLWVLGEGQALDKSERYKHVRAWCARDHALTKLGEVVAMMEGEAQG